MRRKNPPRPIRQILLFPPAGHEQADAGAIAPCS
jgi:hypothetical protein